MVLAVVLDGVGRPVCTEMLPSNTADTTVLLPIVDRLRSHFGIGRVCVVADRGMISVATVAALEERGLDYIQGARERRTPYRRRQTLWPPSGGHSHFRAWMKVCLIDEAEDLGALADPPAPND